MRLTILYMTTYMLDIVYSIVCSIFNNFYEQLYSKSVTYIYIYETIHGRSYTTYAVHIIYIYI